jgi:hypothetical protein
MECRRDDDGLFRLDVGRPDHLGPLLGFFGSTGMDPELGSQNGIMIHGKKTDGTYLVEFRTDASAHADAPHLNARQQAQER